MIRVEHARLVSGLSALAVPEEGTVSITVSRALDPADQRAAVRTAMRAARRAGWLPHRAPGFLLLPLLWGKPAAKVAVLTGKAHAAAAGVAALTATAAAAALVLTVPHAPVAPRPSGAQPAPTMIVHKHHRGRRPDRKPRHHGRAIAVAASGRTTPPVAQVVSPSAFPSPSAEPAPAAQPSPSSSPVVSASVSAGTCVYVLGVKVCLGV